MEKALEENDALAINSHCLDSLVLLELNFLDWRPAQLQPGELISQSDFSLQVICYVDG
jgi:hypothetical protein